MKWVLTLVSLTSSILLFTTLGFSVINGLLGNYIMATILGLFSVIWLVLTIIFGNAYVRYND